MGAWDQWYSKDEIDYDIAKESQEFGFDLSASVHLAVKSWQKCLRKATFDPGSVDGWFGRNTERAVKGFQEDLGLVIDGVIGPQTGKLLVREFIAEAQRKHRIPPTNGGFLCGQSRHESLNDVGCFAINVPVINGVERPDLASIDRGEFQYNTGTLDDLSSTTHQQAFDIAWASDDSARKLRTQFDRYMGITDGNKRRSWRCAIAHHNRPKSADEWARGGLKAVQATSTRTAAQEQARIRGYVDSIWMGC